ncbi:hypothetical protein ACHAXT_000876, partial [Thalassiosira profunda]
EKDIVAERTEIYQIMFIYGMNWNAVCTTPPKALRTQDATTSSKFCRLACFPRGCLFRRSIAPTLFNRRRIAINNRQASDMNIKNIPSFGKAVLLGSLGGAVWGGLAGGGGVLAELGFSGRHAAGGAAVAIWQEAIDAAAAEAPEAATAITSNAVQQEDEVTNIYEKAYKQFGASTFAVLLRSFAVSDDVLWTPFKEIEKADEAPVSLPKREHDLGDIQRMALPPVLWPDAAGKTHANYHDELAGTIEAAPSDKHGGSTVEGHDDLQAIDAAAAEAAPQAATATTSNTVQQEDEVTYPTLAGLRSFMAAGHLLFWTPVDLPQFKANEKANEAPGLLPKNELALGGDLDLASDAAGGGKAAWTEKQPSVALVGEGGQANDGASSNESTPAKWNFLGWKWQFKAIEKAKAHGPLPKNELALGNVLDPVPGDQGSGKTAWTEKQPSALADEGGLPEDGAYDETSPAKWTFSGRKGQQAHVNNEQDELAGTIEAPPNDMHVGLSNDDDGQNDLQANPTNVIAALEQEEEARPFDKTDKYLIESSLGGLLRGFVAACDRLWTPPAIEKAKAHRPLPKNELALGDVLNPVPGDQGSGKVAWTEKQPSALADEGGLPEDGAYDETSPAKWTFAGRKGQQAHVNNEHDELAGTIEAPPNDMHSGLSNDDDGHDDHFPEAPHDKDGQDYLFDSRHAVAALIVAMGCFVSFKCAEALTSLRAFAKLAAPCSIMTKGKTHQRISVASAHKHLKMRRLFSLLLGVVFLCGEVLGMDSDQLNLRLSPKSGERNDNGAAGVHLRGSSEIALDSFANDVVKIFSDAHIFSLDDDIDINSCPEAFNASSSALALLKDRMADPEVLASLPSDFRPLFSTVAGRVSSVVTQMEKVQQNLVKHLGTARTSVQQRLLSASEGRKLPQKPLPGLTKADYHARAKSHRHNMQGHQQGHHQQGYHRARGAREEGGIGRRLMEVESGNVCIETSERDRKREQCHRLASCAVGYSLYDADDIDFDTGAIDSKEKIEVFDEASLSEKLEDIQDWSQEILDAYETDDLGTILDEDGMCDKLLQEFHRFDEDLSINGKWQGGSVTGVCRGFGTTKFVSLESIYTISDSVLNVKDRVENCLQALVNQFDRERENFDVPTLPCEDELKDVEGNFINFGGPTESLFLSLGIQIDFGDEFDSYTAASIIADFRQKFLCLKYSYVASISSDGCPVTAYEVTETVTNPLYVGLCPTVGGTCDLDGDCCDFCGLFIQKLEDAGAESIPTRDACEAVYPPTIEVTTTEYEASCCRGQSYSAECNTACPATMFFQPVFAASSPLGNFLEAAAASEPSGGFIGFFFDYDSPANLPSREDRLTTAPSLTSSAGTFIFDTIPFVERTAEEFTIKVFSDYMGCAYDIVEALSDSDNALFSSDPNRFNPYAPSGGNQFEIPLGISTDGTDKHGQLIATKLDQLYNYIAVGSDTPGIDNSQNPPGLSDELRDYLAFAYSSGQFFDDRIEYFESLDECDAFCEANLAIYRALKDAFFQLGLDRSSLDASIALTFGNKTTIGQVCAYAKGLTDDGGDEGPTVEGLPGFCCLDAPYQSQVWGEKYECQKYEERADGSTILVPKESTDCNKLGPITSGFNEAACDVFYGTWCPLPRDCSYLANCIAEAKSVVQRDRNRQAFFEYLDEAPEVEDPLRETSKCGDLREYFDYDRDYPDDERICEEVLDLQCFTDFSNLDGFATGTAGAGSTDGLEELAVSTVLALVTKEPFDSDAAKVWRSLNFAFRKILQIIEFARGLTKGAKSLCSVVPDPTDISKTVCMAPAVTFEFSFELVAFGINQALDLSEKLYSEIVGGQGSAFESNRQDVINRNVATNHGNIITVFQATQQLKVMLGEVAESLAELDEDEEERRRLQENCVSTKDEFFPKQDKFTRECSQVSCEDPTRICDGTFNFPYVAYLKGAGCDEMDSDGDGEYDVCEDRYGPDVVVRDALLFRGDEENVTTLVYAQKVFNSELRLRNFLGYQFAPVDDCSPTNKLNITIEHTEGTCRDSTWTITPWQNLPECDDREPVGAYNIPFENPLIGRFREVTVPLDEDAPVVTCGFRPDDTSINEVADDNRTLYHYMLTSDGPGTQLSDAQLFYNVNDNCGDDVDINIVVKSNELEQKSTAKLVTYSAEGTVEQAQLLYAPTTCGNVGGGSYCEPSPSNVRFYDIEVSATDSAGNIGTDTCRVVIVSSCDPLVFNEGDCEAPVDGSSKAADFYLSRDYVVNALPTMDPILYEVAEEELVWDSSALPSGSIAYPPPLPSPKCEFSLGPDPLLNLIKVKENCVNTFFATVSDAKECVRTYTEASTDYCYELVIDVKEELVVGADDALSICTDTFNITVTASIEGCPGVTSSESVFLLVDENVEDPRCNFDQGPDVKPALDITRSIQHCENKFFATDKDAEDCVFDQSIYEDVAGGCRPIETEVNSTDVSSTLDARSSCTKTLEVTVTAWVKGCRELLSSSKSVLVLVDTNVKDPSCSFDQGPDVQPALDTTRSIQFCEDKIFATIEEGKMCVLDNAKAEDVAGGCRPIETNVTAAPGGSTCEYEVTTTANIKDCEEEELKTVAEPVNVIVDNDPPVVSCTLETQDMRGKGAGVYTDLKLSFTAVDGGVKCTPTGELDVVLEVLSDEVAEGGNEMVVISKSRDPITGAQAIWAEDITCQTASSGKCKVSSPKASRTYYVNITATDKAGLVGFGECQTTVGNLDPNPGDPLFLIKRVSFTGGFEEEEEAGLLE